MDNENIIDHGDIIFAMIFIVYVFANRLTLPYNLEGNYFLAVIGMSMIFQAVPQTPLFAVLTNSRPDAQLTHSDF